MKQNVTVVFEPYDEQVGEQRYIGPMTEQVQLLMDTFCGTCVTYSDGGVAYQLAPLTSTGTGEILCND